VIEIVRNGIESLNNKQEIFRVNTHYAPLLPRAGRGPTVRLHLQNAQLGNYCALKVADPYHPYLTSSFEGVFLLQVSSNYFVSGPRR
jgi:hypothetical protein